MGTYFINPMYSMACMSLIQFRDNHYMSHGNNIYMDFVLNQERVSAKRLYWETKAKREGYKDPKWNVTKDEWAKLQYYHYNQEVLVLRMCQYVCIYYVSIFFQAAVTQIVENLQLLQSFKQM